MAENLSLIPCPGEDSTRDRIQLLITACEVKRVFAWL
jgi:hypothetical protein